MGMGSYWHWLLLLLFAAAVVVPVWRILERSGNSGWWSLFMVIPGVNLLLLWIIAFAPWPIERKG